MLVFTKTTQKALKTPDRKAIAACNQDHTAFPIYGLTPSLPVGQSSSDVSHLMSVHYRLF